MNSESVKISADQLHSALHNEQISSLSYLLREFDCEIEPPFDTLLERVNSLSRLYNDLLIDINNLHKLYKDVQKQLYFLTSKIQKI